MPHCEVMEGLNPCVKQQRLPFFADRLASSTTADDQPVKLLKNSLPLEPGRRHKPRLGVLARPVGRLSRPSD